MNKSKSDFVRKSSRESNFFPYRLVYLSAEPVYATMSLPILASATFGVHENSSVSSVYGFPGMTLHYPRSIRRVSQKR